MKKLKNSLFIKTFTLIKNNPLRFFYMLFFDFLFVISLLMANSLINNIIPKNPEIIASFTQAQLMSVLSLLPLYFLLTLLFYSVFKYSILYNIASLSSKTEFSIKRLSKFYLLNLIFLVIFILIYFLLGSFYMYSIKPENLAIVYWLTIIPIISLSYLFLNIAHILFIKNHKLLESIKSAFDITFKKFASYVPLLLFSLLVYLILSSLIFFLNLSMALNQLYIQIISLALFYLMIAFNRIYFYLITNKNVLP